MSGDSLRSTPVTNVAYLTLNGNFGNNNNDAQLIFRPLNKDLAPVSGDYYSLATNQTTDPSLRINRWSSTGQLIGYGFLYDSIFNPPPSTRTVVAGGYGLTNIIYSLDNGFTWFPSTSPFLSECTSIAFNGSMWVAGGGNTLLYSGDGVTWSASPNARSLIVNGSGNGIVSSIAANESIWIAGCAYGLAPVLYSYDGVYWYTATSADPLVAQIRGIAWNGSLWVATGQGAGSNPIIYSYDGIVWYPSVYIGTPFEIGLSVAWNGSQWLAGGQDTSGNTLAYSYDGIHWTAQSCVLIAVGAISWSAGLWLIGGLSETDTLLYGNDGRTWTPVPDSKTLLNQCAAIIWTGTVWLAGGQGTDTIIRSFDGLNWLSANNDALLSNGCLALTVNNVLPNAPLAPAEPPAFLMGGLNPTLAYSNDGIMWNSVQKMVNLDLSGATCQTLLWNGTLWVGGFSTTANTVAYSYDGLVWNTSHIGSTYLIGGCFALAASRTLWLAGGFNNVTFDKFLISSTDGRLWADVSSVTPLMATGGAITTIGYNGSIWIAGTTGTNKVLYSSDGLTNWQASASGSAIFTNACYSVAWNGQIWVGVGGRDIGYSQDGINWTAAPRTTYTDGWATVAYNGSLWVVGGNGGDSPIAYSYDGLYWIASPSARTIFTAACISVAWSGSLWIAGGSGTSEVSAYSYNGITWFPSSTGMDVLPYVYSVATTRMNLLDSSASPVPVLYPQVATQPGQVVYSTGLNDLFVSSIMSINDASGTVQIQGDLSASTVHADIFYGSTTIITNDLSANTIQVGTLTGSNATIEDISASIINVWTDLSASTIHVNDIYGTVVNADTLYANVFEPLSISTEYLSANRISATDISAVNLDAENLYVSGIIAPTITAETLNAGIILATGSSLPIGTLVNETAIIITDDRTTIQNVDLSGTVYIGQGSGYGQLVLDSSGTEDYPESHIYTNAIDSSSGQLILSPNPYNYGVVLTSTETRIANTGFLIDTGTIGKTGSNPNAIVIGTDRTMVQNADLSGLVQFGQGTGYGQLNLEVIGTADNPIASIYPNAADSSGQLGLYGNPTTPGIILQPGNTRVYNAQVSGSGLRIDNGTIGKTDANPNAIVISATRTMVQNADLSGLVQFGQGTEYGQLNLEVIGTADNPVAVIYPNASDSSGTLNLCGNPGSLGISLRPGDTQLYNAHVVGRGLRIDNGTIGKTDVNLNAIVIGDNRTMVQNADLSGTVTIGNGDASGALKIQSDATGQATMFVNTAELGQLTLGSSATNLNAVTITDKYTIIQKADLSGTVYIGDGDVSGALQLASGATGRATIQVNTPVLGELVIGSSDANPNAITITDTSGTIFQNRGDLSGTITIGNLSRGLRIIGGDVSGTIQSFNTLRPTVAISGEILIGSSTANQNAIRITDTATTLKNVSFLGGLLLGNNGTIGSTTSNVNAIVVTDTSGTIFQNRGDLSGTISIGNPISGALQLTGSSSGTTIRPTVASAGRLSIGSSTANPNAIVISDTSGTIVQNRGDLSGTLLIGNPSRGLRITGGDTSGVAIPTGFATMRPSVSVSGCLVLGSSTLNPDAITITDTTTSIKNLSFSGGLLLGNNGTIGTTRDGSNATAITVSDTSGTIIQYLSPKSYNLPNFIDGRTDWTTVLPGPGTYNIWSYHNNAFSEEWTIRTNSLTIPGRYVLAMQLVNQNFVNPADWSSQAYLEIVTEFSGNQTITKTPLLTSINTYSFDLVAITTRDVSAGATYYPNPGITGFYVTNWQNWSNGTTQILYPICVSGGTTTLGSSQTNPDAITITDTATTIRNLSLSSPTITSPTITGATITTSSFSGTLTSSALTSSTSTLTLGSSGNTTAINISDTATTIKNLSPYVTDLGTINNGDTLAVTGPGQYIFEKGAVAGSPTTATVNLTIPGRYIFTCYTGTVGSMTLTLNALRDGSQRLALTTSNLNTAPPIFTYSFDVIQLNLSRLYITNNTLNQVYPLYPT